ncbi:translation initiation factor IF-5A [Candidatus Woesearchaeota archaeon CG08_land_8_20_14_0_20_47_9]|nr:MAG: translation initiation factor IF-5A [Candidatus Woesearchaeota archaeon CG1_02_47_18]PIO03234.1 MAG: translation initiation factor IF-5A [Candidatus Woesearchaeota archaeon CG08_land_8_20_14_0_20_47_9]HII30008.1 translation initiation factor IF-5A [Candidatus Woesearchaeota archaeon]
MKKIVSASSIKEGSYIIMDDVACKATNIQVSRPGKHGHAKVRVEGIGLIDGKKRVIVMPGHDNVEVPIIEKKNAQVLSIHGDVANIMDRETYETFDLAIPPELKDGCTAGCVVLYWQILGDRVMKQIKSESED